MLDSIRNAMEEVRMTFVTNRVTDKFCRVYWRTHGCNLERGHEGEHICQCGEKPRLIEEYGWVDKLYGEDVHNAK